MTDMTRVTPSVGGLCTVSFTGLPGGNHGLDLAIHGTPEQVRGQLRDLQQFTGVDEVLVTGDMGDYEGRARSEQLLVEL